jgi:hypothetical protein
MQLNPQAAMRACVVACDCDQVSSSAYSYKHPKALPMEDNKAWMQDGA